MKGKTIAAYFLYLLLVCTSGLPAAHDVREYMPLESDQFELPDSGSVGFTRYAASAEWLAEKLTSVAGRWTASGLKEAGAAAIQLFHLGRGGNVPYESSDTRFGESYRIEIDRVIRIYAGGEAGARYAVSKLIELLGKEKKLDAAIITDYPDYRWRGIVIKPGNTSCGSPLELSHKDRRTWLECMKLEIDRIAELRLNLLGINSPLFSRMNTEDVLLLKNLFLYARQLNVEPMPIIDTKLWGVPVSDLKINAIEGIYREEQPFVVREGYLVPDRNSGVESVQWMQDANSGKSWKDQSKRGDRWKSKKSHRTNSGNTQAFAIEMTSKEKPWRNSLLLGAPSTGQRIKVQPNSYYELGIRVRTDADQGGHVLIGVSQYDRTGLRIEGVNRYPVKLRGRNDKYVKRWAPVFTALDTHSILIRVAPQLNSGKPGRLEVDDIEFRPMHSELINVLDNSETSLVVSRDGEVVYQKDIDYEIKDLMVKEWRDYSFEKIQRARLKVKPGSALKEGDRVSLDFDTLPLEYRAIPRSKYSAASKYTYEEFGRLFRQLGNLSPKFIQVSFTEHYGGLNRDARSKRLGKSNRGLLYAYMNSLDRILRLKGDVTTPGGKFDGVGLEGATLVVWDDMLNPWHNGRDARGQEAFGGVVGATGILPESNAEPSLSKSIWLSSWWYRDEDKNGIVKKTPNFYEKNEFNFFVAAWYQKEGIKHWLQVADPDKVQGLLATTWNGNTAGVKAIACAGWSRKDYPSCLMGE